VQRSIIGFRTDEEGHWVALLDCGHPQHVRHDPPLVERPWVTTPEGRATRIGARLDCVRCDRFELPADAVRYKETAELTETTLPAALRRDHTTKAGVWARIVVGEGTLRYHVDGLGVHADVTPAAPAVVVPEVPHHVEPLGAVRLHVEFYRVGPSARGDR
jgi:tellurite methyltransferase